MRSPIAAADEQSLSIEKLYVHPVRSIRALPVDRIFIGPWGVKFDREIALYMDDADTEMISAKFFTPICELSQEITYKL